MGANVTSCRARVGSWHVTGTAGGRTRFGDSSMARWPPRRAPPGLPGSDHRPMGPQCDSYRSSLRPCTGIAPMRTLPVLYCESEISPGRDSTLPSLQAASSPVISWGPSGVIPAESLSKNCGRLTVFGARSRYISEHFARLLSRCAEITKGGECLCCTFYG
jgi:hypothetical protein